MPRASPRTCTNRFTISAKSLEEAVLAEIDRALRDPAAVDHFVEAVERRVAAADGGREAERTRLERRLEDVGRRLARCVRVIEESDDPIETLRERIRELETEKTTASKWLEDLNTKSPKITAARSAVLGWLERTSQLLRESPAKAKPILRQAVSNGVAKPLGRGRYEIRFEIAPLGLLVELGVPTSASDQKGGSLCERGDLNPHGASTTGT